MAKIVVKLHGQTLSELELVSGREYFAGRGSQSDIIMAQERGISRQHIKFYEEGGHWVAQLVAKYGGLIFQEQSVTQLRLEPNVVFLAPPYEFSYIEESQKKHTPPARIANENEIVSEQSAPLQADHLPAVAIDANSSTQISGNLDATSVGFSDLLAYIKITNSKTNSEELLKLEGNTWTVGRHPVCEIVIDDSAISRKHFDITRTNEGYFITDHGSSNGTAINGEKIAANEPTRVTSGDVISVRHISILFEVRNANHLKSLSVLPTVNEASQTNSMVLSEASQNTGTGSALVPIDVHKQMAVIRLNPQNLAKVYVEKFKKLNNVRKALVSLSAVLVIGLVINLFSSGGSKDLPSRPPQQPGDPNEPAPDQPLSSEKMKEARDIFHIARNQYLERKYSLCIAQIEKLHAIIPFYENSKEIDSLCKQALELEKIEQDRQRKLREKQELENEVRKIVTTCEGTITPNTTYDEISTCLAPAFDRDPENGAALELQTRVKMQEEDKLESARKLAAYQEKKTEGRMIFNRAEQSFKARRLKQALADYNRFIRGNYPEMNVQIDVATRNVASIKKTLEEKLNAQIRKCNAAVEQPNLKSAIAICDEVLKENPGNQRITELRKRAFSQLQTQMREMYNDSVLEENIGNVEAAKEKWNKILQDSIPEDDFYQKAKSKLKKYGIGL